MASSLYSYPSLFRADLATFLGMPKFPLRAGNTLKERDFCSSLLPIRWIFISYCGTSGSCHQKFKSKAPHLTNSHLEVAALHQVKTQFAPELSKFLESTEIQ